MLQQATKNPLETDGKTWKNLMKEIPNTFNNTKRHINYKSETNGNYGTEKYNTPNKNSL